MPAPTNFLKLRAEEHGSRVQDNIQGTLGPIAVALNSSPIMGVAPVWIAHSPDPAFAAVAGQAVAAYYKDSLMRVWSKGVLATAAGVAAGATILTFPAGYRPKEPQRLAVRGDVATVQFVTVAPTGICTPDIVIAAGGTIALFFSFLAEQ